MQQATLQPMVLLWSLYPLAGNLTSADRLTFCWPANKECHLLHPKSGCSFKKLSRLIASGFSHCLLPLFSFLPLIQLWCGWISYPMDQKRKNTPKRSPATRAKQTQLITYFIRNCCMPSCSNVGWCYPIHWINHYPVDNSTIGFPILIHWIMISLVDSAIKQQGPVSVI